MASGGSQAAQQGGQSAHRNRPAADPDMLCSGAVAECALLVQEVAQRIGQCVVLMFQSECGAQLLNL
jgi:hypothetical protein